MAVIAIIKKVVEKGKRRALQCTLFGKNDVREALSSLPFGFDCNPIENMRGIYIKTSDDSAPVLVGYINTNFITEPGESRIFSMNEKGELKTSVYCKKDGTLEVGGNVDYMVRYSALETSFNKLKDDVNKLVDAHNNHTHAGVITAVSGGSGAPAVGVLGSSQTTTTKGSKSTADITPSKIEEIKTL